MDIEVNRGTRSPFILLLISVDMSDLGLVPPLHQRCGRVQGS